MERSFGLLQLLDVKHYRDCTLQFRLCSCGTIHGYLVSLTPLPPHSPLHVGDPITQESDFVLHFNGDAFRELGVGGAGTVLWLHSHGRLQLLSSHCIPAPMPLMLKQRGQRTQCSSLHNISLLILPIRLLSRVTIALSSISCPTQVYVIEREGIFGAL